MSNKSGQTIGISSISAFENSDREPKFWQLSRLAEIYKRPVEFFFSDEPLVENVMLWRAAPSAEDEMKETEAEFRQLCQQYHTLEVVTGEVRKVKLPEPDVTGSEEFDYRQANLLAQMTQREFLLGDIPSTSLKQTLE